jgi:hypothetical protein
MRVVLRCTDYTQNSEPAEGQAAVNNYKFNWCKIEILDKQKKCVHFVICWFVFVFLAIGISLLSEVDYIVLESVNLLREYFCVQLHFDRE